MKNKMLAVNFLIVCLNFYCVPLLVRHSAIETLGLLVVMPLLTIILGFAYTMMNTPHWSYPLVVGIAFLPTTWFYYNLSGVVFAMIHFLSFIIGCLIGIIVHNLMSRQQIRQS